MHRFTPENAKAYGAKGGRTTRRITLERAVRELGELETVEDAKRRLDRLMSWGAAGLLPGTMVNGLVRAVEVWLRAKEAEANFETVAELQDAVRALTADRDRLAAQLQRSLRPGARGAA